ncbi:hypothetical protein ES703_82034 [subsurface metagenome]
MPPVKQAHPSTENHPGISRQLLSQVGLIKPYYPDIARFIAHNSFSAPPATQHSHLSLPYIGNDSLLLPLGKLGDRFPLAIVKVTVRKEIKQVPDCLHPQLIKLGRQAGANASNNRNG